jgi:hypothetical protein
MRKFNLLMKIVAINLTFILLSCSKSDSSDSLYAHFAEVVTGGIGGVYFVDSNGIRLNPTLESIVRLESSNVNFADGVSYIQYMVVSDDSGISGSNSGPFTINLFAATSIDRDFANTDNLHFNDFAPTAPIVSLSGTLESDGNIHIMNDRYLILEVNYFIGLTSNGKANPHDFTIVYNSDETSAGSTNLKLYLSHDSNGDTTLEYQSIQLLQSDLSLFYMAFDLNGAINHFKSVTGKNEFQISLMTDIAGEYYQTISDAEQKEYFYNYKP